MALPPLAIEDPDRSNDDASQEHDWDQEEQPEAVPRFAHPRRGLTGLPSLKGCLWRYSDFELADG